MSRDADPKLAAIFPLLLLLARILVMSQSLSTTVLVAVRFMNARRSQQPIPRSHRPPATGNAQIAKDANGFATSNAGLGILLACGNASPGLKWGTGFASVPTPSTSANARNRWRQNPASNSSRENVPKGRSRKPLQTFVAVTTITLANHAKS